MVESRCRVGRVDLKNFPVFLSGPIQEPAVGGLVFLEAVSEVVSGLHALGTQFLGRFKEAQGQCVHVGSVRQTQGDVSIEEVGVDLDGRLEGTPGVLRIALVPVNHAFHPVGLVVEGGIAKHRV